MSAPGVLAQPGGGLGGAVPCEVAAKATLDAADEAAIRRLVSESAPRLRGDAAESARGREELLAPLACAQVSFAFRLKYSDALVPALSPIVTEGDEGRAVNALIVLARVRTLVAGDALAPGLKSPSPVVRFASASAHRRLLQEVARDSFGFNDAAIDRLLDTLAAALTGEADSNVADMLVLALGDAVRGNAAMRGRAMLRLTDAAAARAASLRTGGQWSDGWSASMLRALDLIRQGLFEQAGAGQIDKEFARRGCLFSGQIFAVARDRLAAGTALDSDLVRSVGAAEGLAVIAHNAIATKRVGEQGIQRLIEQASGGGDAGPFNEAIEPWIGKDGSLTKAPFNGKAADFAPAQ